jgi:hypothetical protein
MKHLTGMVPVHFAIAGKFLAVGGLILLTIGVVDWLISEQGSGVMAVILGGVMLIVGIYLIKVVETEEVKESN